MTQNPTEPDWGRSVGAVVAGFICIALLSVGTDAFMHARGIFPPSGEAMSDGLFLLAAGYRLVFTVLGGYVTAALAPRQPKVHVFILGVIGTLAATAGVVASSRKCEFIDKRVRKPQRSNPRRSTTEARQSLACPAKPCLTTMRHPSPRPHRERRTSSHNRATPLSPTRELTDNARAPDG